MLAIDLHRGPLKGKEVGHDYAEQLSRLILRKRQSKFAASLSEHLYKSARSLRVTGKGVVTWKGQMRQHLEQEHKEKEATRSPGLEPNEDIVCGNMNIT